MDQKSALFAAIFCCSCFLNKGFDFQSSVCNGCHDILMMSYVMNSIAILNLHGVEFCSIIVEISKSEAINLSRHVDMSEKTIS